MNDKINNEVTQFDADEQDNLNFFQGSGASELQLATVKGIIADERLHVQSGEETAMDAEDNVDDRADTALDPENDEDDDGTEEDVVQSIEAQERQLEQDLYGSDR